MRIDPRTTYCVLTGDIVGSSELALGARRRLAARLKRVGAELQRAHGAALPLPLEVFRGDAWQLFVARPGAALRVALGVVASLRQDAEAPLATRIGLGLGSVRFVPGRAVSGGDGEAYAAAGSALDALGPHARMQLAVAPREAAAVGVAPAALLRALVTTVDGLAQDWTPARARAVQSALTGVTQAEAAARWRPKRITQQAVAQHLAKARWSAVEAALAAFEVSLDALLPVQAPVLVKADNKRGRL